MVMDVINATDSIAVRAIKARAMAQNVPSPCISICKMDEQRVLCVGCLRTLQEIRDWSTMNDVDKRDVWSRIEQRAAAQESARSLRP
jgi:predicted Fe-S protein YdhL (DUF1289 family)